MIQTGLSRAGVLFVRALIGILGLVPLGWSLALARGVADLALRFGFKRETIEKNLDYVFGDTLSPAARRRIAKEANRNALCMAFEILRATNRRTTRDQASLVTFDPMPLILSGDEDPRGVIFAVAHSGNIDLPAVWWTQFRKRKIGVVMKPLKNPVFNDLLVRTRERLGFRVISSKDPRAIERINALIRRGENLCILPDQNARGRGVTVDFLGRPASTFKGPAMTYLVSREHARLIVAVPTRPGGGRDHLVHLREITDFVPSGDHDRDVLALTARISREMGDLVRQHPASYLWHHRRWGKAPWQTPAR